ncbi:MAG: PhoPQ-activated pathogenicity [bacterium]|nr:PhoPQ-activated pathogenicity [bacterium]
MRYRHKALAVGLLLVVLASTAAAGPLEEYVRAPDPSFGYVLHSAIEGDGYTAFVLRLTSQTWRGADAKPAVWEHWLTVIKPDEVASKGSLLYIGGGKHTDEAPMEAPARFATIAKQTKSVVSVLQNVPNQPLVFTGEEEGRTEDEIIAYTFAKYVETDDSTWPVLVAMVKSAVRAMDAVQAFCVRDLTPPVVVNEFVVTGVSKRGWTTWLTAAVDARVVAIAPQVIDVLNMAPQMRYQRECYGDYSEEVNDYKEMNLMDLVESPEGADLRKIVDPYSYIEDLTLPKLVLLGSGDEYWTVDAAKLYFPELKGPKFIRYEPNADHGQFDNEGPVRALTAFYAHILADREMPRFSWTIKKNGEFEILTESAPVTVRAWSAVADTKDFRRMTIGDAWKSQIVAPRKPGVYRGRVRAPESGYGAYFFELEYACDLGFNYSLTTAMGVRK